MSLSELRLKNDFIMSLLDARFNSERERLDYSALDYNGIEYKVASAKGSKDVSIQVKVAQLSNPAYRNICLNYIKEVYKDTLQEIDDEGWELKFIVDTEKCVNDREESDKFALLARNIAASSYKWAFDSIHAKTPFEPLTIPGNNNDNTYIYSLNNRLFVCFQLYFIDESDKTIAKVLLTELVNRVKTQGYALAPQVHVGSKPSPEIENILKIKYNNDITYITFALETPSRISEKKIEECIDRFASFRCYLRYHIKASKVMVHTRMKNRVSSFLKILNRAKTDNVAPTRNVARQNNYQSVENS